MISDQTFVSQKAANISTDMSFLKQLAEPTVQEMALRSARVGNIGNLAQLLKLKNSRFAFSEQTRETGQEWVRKKGGDLNPLLERVKQIKRQTKTKQQQKKSESQCQFYLPSVTYENQDIYVKNNFDFGLISTMQSIMSEDKGRGNLTKRILNRRLQNKLDRQQSPLDGLPVINLQIRNLHKKAEYLKATMQILSIDHPLKGVQWSTIYGNAIKQQFWQIILNQMNFYFDQPSRENPISLLALASLKMVENQLSTDLPSHYDSILYYLTNHYLGKMAGHYDSQGNLGPIWGICFVLYRAGRKDQFFRVIRDKPEIVKLFQQAQASIREGKPKKVSGLEQSADLFYNQLLYALKGLPKCSTEALCSQDSLDIVWVFLRNVGIFPQNASIFLSLRKDLYESYKGYLISGTKIKNLLYLLGYSQIAEIGCNDLMDQDDYVHYLITLYHSPLFKLLTKQKRQFVQRRLTQQLVHYIQQLLLQHKLDYINYMTILPQPNIPQQISSIIASSQLLQTIDWTYLRLKIPPNIFQKLVHMTLQKYVSFHQDYIQVAKKESQLLNNHKAALEFIVEMFVKSVLVGRIQEEEIRKGEMFGRSLLGKDQGLNREYSPVFDFFQQYRTLIKILQQRNQPKMSSFLRSTKYILISQQLTSSTKSALQKLLQHSGFECYILYLKNMVKCFEIALIKIKKGAELREVNLLTLNALVQLMKMEPYCLYSGLESVRELVGVLGRGAVRGDAI